MDKLIQTKDTISRKPMTINVSQSEDGIDIATIDGRHHSTEQFKAAWEREISEKKLSTLVNFIPLTREGAERLRDALTKALEAPE